MTGNNESGFSLLELMMAAMLTVGLMGAVLSLANRNQQVFVTEFGVIDMNQNMRTAMDMLTRDIQSAGMGLPRGVSNFASIFYKDGTTTDPNAPDEIMMLNGDPFAPVGDLKIRETDNSKFSLEPPLDVTIAGSGSATQITYKGKNGATLPIYKAFSTDPKIYLVYDDTRVMMFRLTQDGQAETVGSKQVISVRPDLTTYSNPPTTFGSAIGTGAPNYDDARVAVMSSSVAYRLNRDTGELERTDDLQNWFPVARGIINFQVRYRVLVRNTFDAIEEKITSRPGWDIAGQEDVTASGARTSRRDIRSVVITIEAETPEAPPGSRSYRRITQKFEITPRNFNLLNNNNLKAS